MASAKGTGADAIGWRIEVDDEAVDGPAAEGAVKAMAGNCAVVRAR